MYHTQYNCRHRIYIYISVGFVSSYIWRCYCLPNSYILVVCFPVSNSQSAAVIGIIFITSARSRTMNSLQIVQELERLRDTGEDESGEESGSDMPVETVEDTLFLPDNITSEDSSDEESLTNISSHVETDGQHLETRARRGRGRGRTTSRGSRSVRGARPTRTPSAPVVGDIYVASDGTECRCVSHNQSG